MIKIIKPLALNELGGRENNEDSVFPLKNNATNTDKVFLVCDGVGGANKGEVASKILSEGIAEYFKNNEFVFSENEIKSALKSAEIKMQEYIDSNPESKGMASTLTCTCIAEHSVFAAWVGDSRIYQIRNGNIVFKTKDHSYMNYLIGIGEITEEQAKTHPKRNQIMKAVQGAENSVLPDVVEITDIEVNDYFFMCTDGVLEVLTDELIQEVFSGNYSDDEIQNKILTLCYGKTKDNFSMYFYRIISAVKPTETSQNTESKLNHSVSNERMSKSKAFIITAIILALVAAYFLFFNSKQEKPQEQQNLHDTISINDSLKTNSSDSLVVNEVQTNDAENNSGVESTSSNGTQVTKTTPTTPTTVSTKMQQKIPVGKDTVFAESNKTDSTVTAKVSYKDKTVTGNVDIKNPTNSKIEVKPTNQN